MDFKQKYLQYKTRYLVLKTRMKPQMGGGGKTQINEINSPFGQFCEYTPLIAMMDQNLQPNSYLPTLMQFPQKQTGITKLNNKYNGYFKKLQVYHYNPNYYVEVNDGNATVDNVTVANATVANATVGDANYSVTKANSFINFLHENLVEIEAHTDGNPASNSTGQEQNAAAMNEYILCDFKTDVIIHHKHKDKYYAIYIKKTTITVLDLEKMSQYVMYTAGDNAKVKKIVVSLFYFFEAINNEFSKYNEIVIQDQTDRGSEMETQIVAGLSSTQAPAPVPASTTEPSTKEHINRDLDPSLSKIKLDIYRKLTDRSGNTVSNFNELLQSLLNTQTTSEPIEPFAIGDNQTIKITKESNTFLQLISLIKKYNTDILENIKEYIASAKTDIEEIHKIDLIDGLKLNINKYAYLLNNNPGFNLTTLDNNDTFDKFTIKLKDFITNKYTNIDPSVQNLESLLNLGSSPLDYEAKNVNMKLIDNIEFNIQTYNANLDFTGFELVDDSYTNSKIAKLYAFLNQYIFVFDDFSFDSLQQFVYIHQNCKNIIFKEIKQIFNNANNINGVALVNANDYKSGETTITKENYNCLFQEYIVLKIIDKLPIQFNVNPCNITEDVNDKNFNVIDAFKRLITNNVNYTNTKNLIKDDYTQVYNMMNIYDKFSSKVNNCIFNLIDYYDYDNFVSILKEYYYNRNFMREFDFETKILLNLLKIMSKVSKDGRDGKQIKIKNSSDRFLYGIFLKKCLLDSKMSYAPPLVNNKSPKLEYINNKNFIIIDNDKDLDESSTDKSSNPTDNDCDAINSSQDTSQDTSQDGLYKTIHDHICQLSMDQVTNQLETKKLTIEKSRRTDLRSKFNKNKQINRIFEDNILTLDVDLKKYISPHDNDIIVDDKKYKLKLDNDSIIDSKDNSKYLKIHQFNIDTSKFVKILNNCNLLYGKTKVAEDVKAEDDATKIQRNPYNQKTLKSTKQQAAAPPEKTSDEIRQEIDNCIKTCDTFIAIKKIKTEKISINKKSKKKNTISNKTTNLGNQILYRFDSKLDEIKIEDNIVTNLKVPILNILPKLSFNYVLEKKKTFIYIENYLDKERYDIFKEKYYSTFLLFELNPSMVFLKIKSEVEYRLLELTYDYCNTKFPINFFIFDLKQMSQNKFTVTNCNLGLNFLDESNSRNGFNDDENVYQNLFFNLGAFKKRYKPGSQGDKSAEDGIDKFISNNPICSSIVTDDNGDGNESIESLKQLIIINITTIIKTELDKISEFETFNSLGNDDSTQYHYMYKFLQLNLLKERLESLPSIEHLRCNELADINNRLKFDIKKRNDYGKMAKIFMTFELLTGLIISNEQWEFFDEIIKTYKKNKSEIFQLTMGKGKSSVILPLLVLYFNKYKVDFPDDIGSIYIIIPDHLIDEMNKRFELLKIQFNLNLTVMSDADAKKRIIGGKGFEENDIMIFDEIDYQYDAMKSIFNIADEDGEKPFNYYHIDYIINKYESEDGAAVNNDAIDKKVKTAIDDIINTNTQIKNIDFGMSRDELNAAQNDDDVQNDDKKRKEIYYNRRAIPYQRQDSPLEGSKFSSIALTLVLTVKYFKENDYKLELRDFKNILTSLKNDYEFDDDDTIQTIATSTGKPSTETLTIDEKKTLEKQKEDNFKLHIINKLVELNPQDLKDNQTALAKITKLNYEKRDERIKIVKTYMDKFVIERIDYSVEIRNSSFIDVMNYDCKWKTGFSGTVNVDFKYFKNCTFNPEDGKKLPNKKKKRKTSNNYKISSQDYYVNRLHFHWSPRLLKITNDTDEKLSVKFAIFGNYQTDTSKNRFFQIPGKITNQDNNKSEVIIKSILAKLKTVQQSSGTNVMTYNCLVDIEGIFRDYDSKQVITQIKNNQVVYKEWDFIYIDTNDTKKIIKSDGKEENFYSLDYSRVDKTFAYFSQRHIIGIDIPNQPSFWHGFCIVSNKSFYTNIAQGIFRLRKLNKGQYIDFFCIDYTESTIAPNQEQDNQLKLTFYDKIYKNEKQSNDSKIKNLDLQILKFEMRTNSTNPKKYLQTDMVPLYLREGKETNIINIFKKQLENSMDSCKSKMYFYSYLKRLYNLYSETTITIESIAPIPQQQPQQQQPHLEDLSAKPDSVKNHLMDVIFGSGSTEKENAKESQSQAQAAVAVAAVADAADEAVHIRNNINIKTKINILFYENVKKYCLQLYSTLDGTNQMYCMPEFFQIDKQVKDYNTFKANCYIVHIKHSTSQNSHFFVLFNKTFHNFNMTIHPVYDLKGTCINSVLFDYAEKSKTSNYLIKRYYTTLDLLGKQKIHELGIFWLCLKNLIRNKISSKPTNLQISDGFTYLKNFIKSLHTESYNDEKDVLNIHLKNGADVISKINVRMSTEFKELKYVVKKNSTGGISFNTKIGFELASNSKNPQQYKSYDCQHNEKLTEIVNNNQVIPPYSY